MNTELAVLIGQCLGYLWLCVMLLCGATRLGEVQVWPLWKKGDEP